MLKSFSSKIKKITSKTSKKNNTSSNKKSEAKATFKLAIVFCLLFGALIGYVSLKFICKNDCFEMVGTKNITLSIGDTYVDAGVKVVAFGKEANDKIIVEVFENNTNIGGIDQIDTSKETTYQIVYTVSSFRYKDIRLIRTLQIINELAQDDDAVVEEWGKKWNKKMYFITLYHWSLV